MKSFNYYKDILTKNGYKETYQETLNGVPISVDFENDKSFLISLGVQPNDEYYEELSQLSDGTKYIPDFNRFEVHTAFFGCSICNVKGFMDGDKSGIILKESEPIRESLLDIMGGDQYQEYYPHKMDLFEKCIWIQNNIMEHEENILISHVANLKRFREEFNPVLKELDFYQYYSSVFDCTEDNDCNRENSNLFILYKHRADESCLSLETDCITGGVVIAGKAYDSDNLKQYIIDNFFMYDDSQMRLQYRYLFDKDYDIKSYAEIGDAFSFLRCLDNYKVSEDGYKKWFSRLKTIDVSLIPEKDYKYLLDDINEKLSK